MSSAMQTQEVGSLAKPDWRVAAMSNQLVTDEQINAAALWAERLELDPAQAEQILGLANRAIAERGQLQPTEQLAVKWLAARYAVRLQEKAGLDIIYDGEQDRSEMYQHAIERTGGFSWRGRVRSFDNKSYKKAACVSEPSLASAWHTQEVSRLKDLTDHAVKVPITGAYTLAAWSYNEHYSSRAELVHSLARNVLRPNIIALLDQGVEWVQIDEPAATTVPAEVGLFVDSFEESVGGLKGKFSLHICFSDYSLLFPDIERLEHCSQFSLEFANRDGRELGVDAGRRPAYEILARLKQSNPEASIGLGVTSVHDDQLESAELVRDRVLRAVDIIGDPAKIYPSPDCGLRTRSWEIAYQKLVQVVEGTNQANQVLGV